MSSVSHFNTVGNILSRGARSSSLSQSQSETDQSQGEISVREAIERLSRLRCPPIPVAPQQNPRDEGCHKQFFVEKRFFKVDPNKPEIQGNYCQIATATADGIAAPVRGDYCQIDEHLQPIPRFTGKNPSYLDRDGKPRILNHNIYQKRLPNYGELKEWFANPNNGVGTLGGHGGVVWLDFDAKNYASQEKCDADVQKLLHNNGLKQGWVEKTGSGGYRVAVKPLAEPTFTNFATTPDGQHIGEALYKGRFTVLAPTKHPNGNYYQRLSSGDPVEVESLEAIGIYPTKDEQANQKRKQKREKRQAKTFDSKRPSNLDVNPWDIRQFAKYLSGYHEDGGWGYAQCPGTPSHPSPNSGTSFRVNLDTGATKHWCGCDPKEVYKSALDRAYTVGYQIPKRETQKRQAPDAKAYRAYVAREAEEEQAEAAQANAGIFDGIKALLAKGSRKLKPSKGFTRVATASEVHEYAEGDRLKTWIAATKTHRYILDQSGTGGGKTHDSGLAQPNQFDCRQLLYTSAEHRDPSTQTLAVWDDLEARHNGLVVEKTPNGSDRLRRAKKGESPSIAGNCSRTNVIETLRTKAIDGADSAGVVCSHCPLREACCNASGAGYGYLNERRNGLLSSRLRLHPASLPAPQIGMEDTESRFDYSGVGLIWDEPGASFQTMRSINVSLRDVEQLTLLLTAKPEHSNLFQALQPLLTALRQYLDGSISTGKFGLNHQQVLALLQAIAQELLQVVSLEAIRTVTAPDLSFLNTVNEYGVELEDLPAHVRKKFADRDAGAAEKAETSLVKQWLLELLGILSGDTNGHLHLGRQQLTITLPDDRARGVVRATKFNIFTDATLTREDLALKLGCDPKEIFVCRQQVQTHGNLKLIQVHDLGRLGMQRGAEQQRRAAAIVAHYQALDATTKAIDFKRCADEGMGVWWRDSRGTNDFLTCTTLVLIGTPCRNLASLQAEYGILTGCYDLEDAGFKAFVDRAILADYHQAIGRLRANRRPDERLQIVIVSDFELDIQTELVKGSAVCVEAAGKFERFQLAVKNAADSLKAAGAKLTQTAIAGVTGYSQQYIARFWKLLLLLIDNSISKSSKNAEPPPDGLEAVVETAIGYCLDSPQVLTTIQEIFFEWLKPSQWGHIWEQLTIPTQQRILEALAYALPLPSEVSA